MISFYIGLTGFACAIYYRRELLRSVKNFFFIGVGPTLGGAILFYLLIKNGIELSDPANSESGNSWFGLGPPLRDRRLLPGPRFRADGGPVAQGAGVLRRSRRSCRRASSRAKPPAAASPTGEGD